MPPKPIKDGFELSATKRTLPIALLRAREVVMDQFRPLLVQHGVTEQQWRVLRVLKESDDIDAGALAQSACILAPSLSRIIKTLESKGYIELRRDPNDGRRSLIRLTKGGDAFIRKVATQSAAIYARIESQIGQETIESLLDNIERILLALHTEN